MRGGPLPPRIPHYGGRHPGPPGYDHNANFPPVQHHRPPFHPDIPFPRRSEAPAPNSNQIRTVLTGSRGGGGGASHGSSQTSGKRRIASNLTPCEGGEPPVKRPH